MGMNFGGLGLTLTVEEKNATKSFENLAASVDKFSGSLEALDFESVLDQAAPFSQELAAKLHNTPEQVQAMFGLDTPAEKLFRKMKSGFEWFKKSARSDFSAAGKEAQKYVTPVIAGFGKVKSAFGTVGKALSGLGPALKGTVGFFSGFFKSASTGVSKLTDGFGNLAGVINRMDKLVGLQRIQTFVQGAILGKLNDFANKVSAIGEVNNLTTGWEAHWQQLGVQARKTGANFGYTGKELDKFTGKVSGMMHGMQISSEAAGQAVKGFKMAQKELAAVGITNAEDLAKLADVTGVSADIFQETLRKASKEFGFADKDLQKLTSSFLDAGKAIGDVPKMMGSLPKMTEMLNRLKAAGVTSATALADYAKQTAALTKGFYASGKSAEMSTQLAMTLTEKLVESRENIRNMFAGTESDLNNFSLELGISVGDISDAFKLMQSGPQGMMTGLAKMAMSAKKNGKDVGSALGFMSARLEQAVGKEAAAELTNFIGNANESVLAQMAATDKATQSLGQFAKESWRSSRTAQDGFNDMKDAFITGFRNIGREGVANFMTSTNKEFQHFNKVMADTAAKGGPMGAVIKKMAEMHQMGVSVLIPEALRPLSVVMGTLVGQMLPMAAQLGALGFRVNMLVNPFVLLAAAVGYVIYKFYQFKKMSGGDVGKAMDKLKDLFKNLANTAKDVATKVWGYVKGIVIEVAKNLGPLLNEAISALKNVNFAKVFDDVLGEMLPALITIAFAFNKLAPKIIEVIVKMLPAIGKAAKKIGDIILWNLSHIDWVSLGKSVGEGAGKLIDMLVPAVQQVSTWALKLVKMLATAIMAIDWSSTGVKIGAGISEILHDLIPKAKEALAWAVGVAQSLLTGLTQAIGSIDWDQLLDDIVDFLGGLPDQLEEMTPQILAFLDVLWTKALGIIAALPEKLAKLLDKLGPMLKRWLPVITKWMLEKLWELVKKLPDLWAGMWKLLMSLVNILVSALIGVLKGLWDTAKAVFLAGLNAILGYFGTTFDDIADTISQWWTWLSGLLDTVLQFFSDTWDWIKNLVIGVWDSISEAWDAATGFFSDLWDGIMDFVQEAWDWIKNKIIGAWDAVKKVWDGVKAYFADIFKGVKDTVTEDIKKVEDIFTGLKDKLTKPFDALMSLVRKNHGNSVNTIVGEDMDKTVKAVQDSAKDITKILDTVLHDAVSKAVFRAFETAFRKIVENTKNFFLKEEMKLFIQLKNDIIKVYASMAVKLLEITSIMSKAMSQDITNVLDEVNKAHARIATLNAAGTAAKSTEVDQETRKRLEAQYAGKTNSYFETEMLVATNNPDWWKQYKKMFHDEMEALRGTIQATPMAAKGNGAAAGAGSDKSIPAIKLSVNKTGTSQ